MTINYHYSTNDDEKNGNLDEVLGNLYAIVAKRYGVVLERGFRIDDTDYCLQIIKNIGYLEQVRNRSKKGSNS